MNKTYLGDAVYAEFNNRIPGDLILTTEDGIRATNTIYFEPSVLTALLYYVQEQRKERVAAELLRLHNEGSEE